MDFVPNDANAMSVLDVGEMCSSLANSAEMNERCAPSSKRIFAWVVMPLAMTGATAVLSEQAVFFGALQQEAGVMSSAMVVGVALPDVSSGFNFQSFRFSWLNVAEASVVLFYAFSAAKP